MSITLWTFLFFRSYCWTILPSLISMSLATPRDRAFPVCLHVEAIIAPGAWLTVSLISVLPELKFHSGLWGPSYFQGLWIPPEKVRPFNSVLLSCPRDPSHSLWKEVAPPWEGSWKHLWRACWRKSHSGTCLKAWWGRHYWRHHCNRHRDHCNKVLK